MKIYASKEIGVGVAFILEFGGAGDGWMVMEKEASRMELVLGHIMLRVVRALGFKNRHFHRNNFQSGLLSTSRFSSRLATRLIPSTLRILTA